MQVKKDSLVLYKSAPARVLSVGDKIAIRTQGGKEKKVRDKDIHLLHPGPFHDFSSVDRDNLPKLDEAAVEEAWELLEGESTVLPDLVELIFGDYDPRNAWHTWVVVSQGVHFEATPNQLHEAIVPRSRETIENERAERLAKQQAKQDWDERIARFQKKQRLPEDDKALTEVEVLARSSTLEKLPNSKILKALDKPETPQAAARLLLDLHYWDEYDNPWPYRANVDLSQPDLNVLPLIEEERRDLTHLQAFAIDDEGSTDPDDAISVDGDWIWVHVADVSALVTPDSALEREARNRGANLYLPEGTIHMLPHELTERLALGLAEESPAFSVGMRLGERGEILETDLTLSRVRVTRISYEEGTERMAEQPFAAMNEHLSRFLQRRNDNGARGIDMPEVKLRVKDRDVQITPLSRGGSRQLVMDAMLLTGEAIAAYADKHVIPMPFSSQPPPEDQAAADAIAAKAIDANGVVSMANMFALRKTFKRGQVRIAAGSHYGLGLDGYTQFTSPLRRYQDLLAHQQLRAYLRGEAVMDSETVLERLGTADSQIPGLRRAERDSNTYWKLVSLYQQPEWQGEAVIIDHKRNKSLVVIPELALEALVGFQEPLDSKVRLRVTGVDLANGVARFRKV